jgi:hypothetical protein
VIAKGCGEAYECIKIRLAVARHPNLHIRFHGGHPSSEWTPTQLARSDMA